MCVGVQGRIALSVPCKIYGKSCLYFSSYCLLSCLFWEPIQTFHADSEHFKKIFEYLLVDVLIDFIICWHPNVIPLNETSPFSLVAGICECSEKRVHILYKFRTGSFNFLIIFLFLNRLGPGARVIKARM